MDDVLRCGGCGLPVGLSDHVVNLAGRRLHRMCAGSHRADTTGRPDGWLAGLRGWVNLGRTPGR
jgi:hypothetical protein